MANGDPANAGANHTNMNTGAATTSSKTLAFAVTAGNTLIVAVRLGSGRTVTAVDVSWNAGTSFTSSATICGSHHTVASAGVLVLFYLPNVTGAAANQTVVRVTADASTSLRWCVGEYVGNLTLSGTETFADSGASNTFNSGNRVLAGTSTLIGAVIGGNNSASSAPWSGSTTNGLTWTIRDELDVTAKAVTALMDFNAGGQAAGTYAAVGKFTGAVTDNVGSAIYSFTSSGASPQTVSPSGLSSAQSFGTIKANMKIFVGGLVSAQSMGSPTVTVGPVGQTVSVSGLASAQRFGAVTPQPGPVIVVVLGIPSAQAFGSILANQTIHVGGIPSAQAFGTITAIPGPTTVSLTGLPSAQAFGTPQVTEPGGPTFSPAIHGGKHF